MDEDTSKTNNSGDEDGKNFNAACSKAEKIALRLIARAEQSSFGLEFKLKQRNIDADVAEEVISRLLDRELLNDQRYAELWIRSCLARKAPSPLWLIVSLGKRGIKRDLASKAIKKVLDNEAEYALLLKYLEKIDTSEKNDAARIKSKLRYEGFSFEILDRFFDN